jgi:hypothetical protein
MPDVKNFDFALAFADVVVDKKWAMQQFANLSPFSNQPAHTRETSQQLDVLDHGTAEVQGSLRVILGNVADDFGEIA